MSQYKRTLNGSIGAGMKSIMGSAKRASRKKL